ncbi:heterokaryon incompatibility protein-domain-containing protein [Xylaria telfairii]|nr:heterokaryon incompatibility protein-domain-containing protein [Xylaria telfairii]
MSSSLDSENKSERATNSNTLCFRCAELNPGFYLNGLRVFAPSGPGTSFKYPESRRCLESMLLRQECPLCRLICNAIVDKLRKEVMVSRSGNDGDGDAVLRINSGDDANSSDKEEEELIGNTNSGDDANSSSDEEDVSLDDHLRILRDYAEEEVVISYIRAASLPDRTIGAEHTLRVSQFMQVEKLFLKIQVSLLRIDITTWIHMLSMEQSTTSSVPFKLPSSIVAGWRFDERVYDRALRGKRDDLSVLLADLNVRNFLAGRVVGETVDIQLLTEWLRLCDKHGNNCQPEPLLKYRKPVWMIDVAERKLVSVVDLRSRTGPKFAALSYVWGGPEIPQLKYSSVNGISVRLKSHGGLDDQQWDDIPHTISDSIFMCQELGIPYLWVDALCLDQDFAHPHADPNMPNPLDDVIGRIYQSAYLTIVCAAGSDSWSGLPGARPQRARKPSWVGTAHLQEQVQDQWLGVYPGSSYQIMTRTRWDTRAWTYQEQLLSKRILAFTDDEVLFECDTEVGWRECIFAEHPEIPPEDFSIPLAQSGFKIRLDALILEPGAEEGNDLDSEEAGGNDGADSTIAASKGADNEIKDDIVEESTSPRENSQNNEEEPRTKIPKYHRYAVHELFSDLIHEYIGRQMTNQSDALRAISGVLRRVGITTDYEISDKGIPSDLFYECLFFDVPHFRPGLRRAGFPSWNWTGWKNDGADISSSRYRNSSERKEENGKEEKNTVATPIRFWSDGQFMWLDQLVPVLRLVVAPDEEADEGLLTTRNKYENLDSNSNAHQKGKATAPARAPAVRLEEILLPGFDKPVLAEGIKCRAEDAFAHKWESSLEDALICVTAALEVHISRNGKKIEDGTGRPNERRYRIIAPDVGLRTIDLDREWRERQGDWLLFIQIGASKAFDPKEKSNFVKFLADGKRDYTPAGWEEHPKRLVTVLLLELERSGLFLRTGMYEIEQEYWDAAPTESTMLALH